MAYTPLNPLFDFASLQLSQRLRRLFKGGGVVLPPPFAAEKGERASDAALLLPSSLPDTVFFLAHFAALLLFCRPPLPLMYIYMCVCVCAR
jgi:hypothetical protein